VQLRNGRLLIPANHAEDINEPDHPFLQVRAARRAFAAARDPSRPCARSARDMPLADAQDARRSRMVSHAIYSDDHGATWQLGGVAAPHTNELAIADLGDGRVVLSARDWSGEFRRQIQTSTDGGSSWGPARYDRALVEPEPWGCQGSLLAIDAPPRAKAADAKADDDADADGGERQARTLFFCNPASSIAREMITVRRSDDAGKSWPTSFVLDEGPSAYSSLGRLPDGSLGVLFERGDKISLASIASLKDGPLGIF